MDKKERVVYKKVINNCNCLNCKYKIGFEILSEYFDSISEEEKASVDKRLKRIGL
jgi:hypothetical protein